MDYETIETGCPECSENLPCSIKCPRDFGWNYGEVTELELPIFGRICLEGDLYLTPEDFLKDSETKFVKMVLQDFLGNVVDEQIARADSEVEYSEGVATCYYQVGEELSKKLKSGTYYLFVSLVNKLPENGDIPERTIFNLMVSKPEGIEITIF